MFFFHSEQQIDANLAQMDREVTAWKARVEKREAEAAQQKALKDTIFAELRQEFGYDINPADPLFKVTCRKRQVLLCQMSITMKTGSF